MTTVGPKIPPDPPEATVSAIAGIFKSIKFPRPQGGGIVQVTYPINLRRAG